MSKWQKELQRMRTNPKNVRFADIDGLLLGLGFEKRIKGSHAVYTIKVYRLTIPYRKPFILPEY